MTTLQKKKEKKRNRKNCQKHAIWTAGLHCWIIEFSCWQNKYKIRNTYMNVTKIVAQNLINISVWLHSLKSQFDILKKKNSTTIKGL